ncbi:MAG: DUF3352 domain-containing protein [Bacteroidetes bacterium]|nr:DUF3352 domain-containing protein [Bacteroidota bacterium]
MKKNLKYIVFTVLSVAFLTAAYLIYTHYKRPALPPSQAIPASSLIFAEFHGIVDLWNEISTDNKMHIDLLQNSTYAAFWNDLLQLDSLRMAWQPLQGDLEQNQQYISMHADSNALSFLFLSGLSKSIRDKSIPEFFSSVWPQYTITQSKYNGAPFYTIDSPKPWYFTVYKKVFAASPSPELVRKAIETLNLSSRTEDPQFIKVKETAGKKVDANLFIRQADFHRLAEKMVNENYAETARGLKNLASWTELDINIKTDEILMNGYTSLAPDDEGQLLGLFAGQEPQEINVTRILPYHTNFLFSYGFSDFRLYYEQYKTFLEEKGKTDDYTKHVRYLNEQNSADMLQYFIPWIGKEVSLALTRSNAANNIQDRYVVIHTGDIDKAHSMLPVVSDPNFRYVYKDYEINILNAPGLTEILFGSLFSCADRLFYTTVEDYIVFTNSTQSLESFIGSFISGKNLKSNINFRKFTDNISDRSNLLFYLNTRNGLDMTARYLSSAFSQYITDNSRVLKNFEGAAMQFSYMNQMLYTNLYLKYNPSYIQEDYALWKVTLDDAISGQPYFVRDHRTNTLKIIVFDESNQMYLIDHNGKIIWKRMIGEPVLSDVHLIDYYGNGKIQYMFNTAGNIFLVDLLGRDVEDYPVKLPGRATNGIAVFDYDGDRNYRIFVAMEDNRIYGFDKKGLPVSGWKKPLALKPVIDPVEYIRAFNKDYIIITDQEGNVRICDRKGNDRIRLREGFTNARHSAFYENKTNSAKGIMITTDQDGRLTYIKTDGSITRTDFGSFSPGHYFLYEDFDRNGHKDFIFLDKNKLLVYDRFKEPIMTYEFTNEIGSSPVVIPLSGNENIIGIVADETRKIYLFDKDGNLLSTPDMIGNTQILVGSLLNDGQLNIIAGSGRSLLNYYFQ